MATAKKKTAPATVEGKATLTPVSEVTLGAKRRTSKRHGPKDKLYALLPKRGHITYRALLTKADEDGLPAPKVKKWVPAWAKKGYITID
jgi:hypothetical protein